MIAAFLLPAAGLVYLFVWSQTGDPLSAQTEIRRAALALERLAVEEIEVRLRDRAADLGENIPFAFTMDDAGALTLIEPLPLRGKTVWPLPGDVQENERFVTLLREAEEREFIRNDAAGVEEVFAVIDRDESFAQPAFAARSALSRAAFLIRRERFDEARERLDANLETLEPAAAPAGDALPFMASAALLMLECSSEDPVPGLELLANGSIPLTAVELRAAAERMPPETRQPLLDRARALELAHLLDPSQAWVRGMADSESFSFLTHHRLWLGETRNSRVQGHAFPESRAMAGLLDDKLLGNSIDSLLPKLTTSSATSEDALRSLPDPAGLEGAVLEVFLIRPEAFEKSAASRRALVTGLAVLLVLAMLVTGFATFRAIRREVAAAKARSDFMAAVSHELRTPLASIRMFAELIEEGRVNDEGTRNRFMRLIRSNCRRLSAMIENVLDLSRSEKGLLRFHLEEVDLKRLLEDLFHDIRIVAEEEGTVFEVEIAEDLPVVRADPTALARAIFNLTDNARKYSDDGARIEVKAAREAGEARISITDQGPGISEKEQQQIFARFQRGTGGNDAAAGMGLGLSLAREAVEGCGGRLEMKSRVGEGSTFTIILPVLENDHGDNG